MQFLHYVYLLLCNIFTTMYDNDLYPELSFPFQYTQVTMCVQKKGRTTLITFNQLCNSPCTLDMNMKYCVRTNGRHM